MSADDPNNMPAPAWTSSDLKANPHDVDDKAGRVQRMFDSIAGLYDLNNRLHSLGRDQVWRRRTAKAAVTGPNDRILDVACGTGDLSEALADQCPASVHGIDFSRGMLDVAIAKAGSRSRTSGAPVPTYSQGNAMELDLPDDSFEACTIAFGIRNVVDPTAAFAEFYRVLAPGGRCLILEFSEPRNAVLRSMSNIYNRRIMPLTATMISGDRSGAYKYLPRSMETFLSPNQLAEQIRSVGFTIQTQRPMTFGICTLSIAQKS